MTETTASPELISELVQKTAAEQNRQLLAELKSLKQQLASLKKGQRGHSLPTNGASQKTNVAPTKATVRQPAQADASAKDSDKGEKKTTSRPNVRKKKASNGIPNSFQ